jgi:hypothetical protein
MQATTPDRIIAIPALYVDTPDAALRVFSADGETASITLAIGTRIIARGETFRRPEIGPYTWFDAPEAEIVDTFGAFLAHAFESSEPDARDGWPILEDEASDWADAMALYGEDENA